MKNQQLRSYTKLPCSALRAVFYLSAFIFSLSSSAQTTTKGFQWIQHHGDGITKNDEKVEAIKTDRWGNIYVAGQVNDLFVRDSSGTNIKSKLAPFLDSLENYGGLDVWLAKYDPRGNLLWHRYAGGGGDDAYYDMVADEDGNCYISGSIFYHNVREHFSFNRVPLLEKDFSSFIAKVNSNGDLVWHKTFGGDTVYLPGANGVYVPYFANPYNLSLQGNTISCFFRGGGDQGFFGYQRLFNQDSLQNGIHEAKFDLNGNYLEAHTFPFPRLDRLPQITSIQSNDKGTFISGNLNRDTVLVGNDTLVKTGSDNAFAAFLDTSYRYINSIYGSNRLDQFMDARLFGDTVAAAGHYIPNSNAQVRFDTINHTASPSAFQESGICLFNIDGKLLGLYPSKSLGNQTATVAAAYIDGNSVGIGGSFNQKLTYSGGSSYVEAASKCTNCTNSDLFFALLDRQGNLIAEDVIYTSALTNSAVFAMHRKDSMLYIGGFVGDSVIIEGVDTFVTRGSNDAFIAAYNVGLVTSIKENSTYIKADNGILAYPNPTQG